MAGWTTRTMLDGGRVLLEGGGISLLAADYAAPWPLEVVEDVRSAVLRSKASNCILLGGHIGEVAMAVRDICRGLVIYEPNPAHCELLVENMEMNGVRAEVRCGSVGTEDGRRLMSTSAGHVRVEVTGIHRVLRGGIDVAITCCSSCSSAAAALSCQALSLVRSYVFPRGSALADRLRSCGFSVHSMGSIELATRA